MDQAEAKGRLIQRSNWSVRVVATGISAWQSEVTSFGISVPPVPTVTPQLANYLTAPNALFHASLQDLGSLHQRLGELRLKAVYKPDGGYGEFFLQGYGGDHDYQSYLNAAQYGYDADITYAAIQANGNLYGFETDKSLIRFGLSGSYGNLGLSPYRNDSQKTKFDLWSIAPYMTWQHQSGAYLDAILSYGGFFDGLVITAARGRTTYLKGNSLTSSLEAGMPSTLGSKAGQSSHKRNSSIKS